MAAVLIQPFASAFRALAGRQSHPRLRPVRFLFLATIRGVKISGLAPVERAPCYRASRCPLRTMIFAPAGSGLVTIFLNTAPMILPFSSPRVEPVVSPCLLAFDHAVWQRLPKPLHTFIGDTGVAKFQPLEAA